jgi:serine/threonine protein kinase
MDSLSTIVGKNGTYQLDRALPLVYGRICVLFRGVDENGSAVCLKLFRSLPRDRHGENATDEFLRELEAHRRIEHPNVLPIIDSIQETYNERRQMFLVMPFVEGGNLRELIRNTDFVPLSDALPILRQIAAAIDVAHTRGVIHGDIKPENVLLSSDRSRAYLCDFGMAKYFAITERISTQISGNAEAGSTAYLSPEQIEFGRQSPRSDVYSFALVAYEILTNRMPFDISVGAFQQMRTKVAGNLIDPALANPYLSRPARAALQRGLALNPDDRFPSATEFCEELSASQHPLSSGASGARGSSPDSKQIFISYSHKDRKWLKKFNEMLKPLLRGNSIRVWDDGNIKPGGLWRKEIEEALRRSKVAVLLVSPSFLASDFISTVETPSLLKAANDGGVTIIWVPVSASLYAETELTNYQASHDPSKPLDALRPPELNRELVRICALVKEAFEG